MITYMEHGTYKKFVSKNGFTVTWHNTVHPDNWPRGHGPWPGSKQGIEISLSNPKNVIKEVKKFAFGQESEAEEFFQTLVEKVKRWDEIQLR